MYMRHVIPAILPEYFEDIESAVARVYQNTTWVQLDLCDGVYVPSKTWPYKQGGWKNVAQDIELPFWQDVNYEVDLMVKNPFEIVEKIMELGASRAVLHVSSAPKEEILKAIRALEHYDIEVVLAIHNNEDVELVYALIDTDHQIHAVQCMGIARPGFQGQVFDERVLRHVAAIREKYPELDIVVDGSVNLQTAQVLVQAGATRLVVGSAIFDSLDSIDTIQTLERVFHS